MWTMKWKKKRVVTDPKKMILKKYHDFLNVFFKQKADKLPFHRKYDHFIELMKKKNINSSFVISNVRTKTEIDKNLFREAFQQKIYRCFFDVFRFIYFIREKIKRWFEILRHFQKTEWDHKIKSLFYFFDHRFHDSIVQNQIFDENKYSTCF